uniref:Uncharacterized protein n=1 Tax=Parascaris equorum TaxID=6256 RepID=A0A914RD94_PAREQ
MAQGTGSLWLCLSGGIGEGRGDNEMASRPGGSESS